LLSLSLGGLVSLVFAASAALYVLTGKILFELAGLSRATWKRWARNLPEIRVLDVRRHSEERGYTEWGITLSVSYVILLSTWPVWLSAAVCHGVRHGCRPDSCPHPGGLWHRGSDG